MTYRAWDLKTLDRAAVRELTHAIAEQRTEELEYSAMDEEPWSEQKYAATLGRPAEGDGLAGRILAARGITDPGRRAHPAGRGRGAERPRPAHRYGKSLPAHLAGHRQWRDHRGLWRLRRGRRDCHGLAVQHLKGMGAAVKCMLPSREGDGYGLSRNAIQSIHDKGYRLIVTVDNGLSAVAEGRLLPRAGHRPYHHRPPSAARDPAQGSGRGGSPPGGRYQPFKGLCGAGVAFKLCAALDDCTPEEMLDYCGDLAAVGTVADVMPLTGENRTLVKAGLRQLQQTDRPGMEALLEEVGLAGKPVTAENISYAIAPRINAAAAWTAR